MQKYAIARNISYLPTAADTVKNSVKRNGNVAHNNNFNNPKKITSSSTAEYKMQANWYLIVLRIYFGVAII